MHQGELNPGDKFGFDHRGPDLGTYLVEFSDGTKLTVILPAGGHVDLTVGNHLGLKVTLGKGARPARLRVSQEVEQPL